MWDQIVAEATTAKNVVEFLKIVLDKGLLAILLALVALLSTLVIERIKSSLAKQQEILKITAPASLKLIEACEDLYKAGMSALHEKASEFAAFEQWANQLLFAPIAKITNLSVADIPHGAGAKDAVLTQRDGTTTSVEELFRSTAPDAKVLTVLNTGDFWSLPAVTGPEGSLVRHLYMSYMRNSGPDTVAAAVHFQMARVFADLKLGRADSYLAALSQFRQEVLKTLYPGNDAQLKAITGIHKTLEANFHVFESFPTLDIGRSRILGSAKGTSAFESLANAHASLVGFVGMHLRSH